MREHQDLEVVCKECGHAECFCTCGEMILCNMTQEQKDIIQDKYFDRNSVKLGQFEEGFQCE